MATVLHIVASPRGDLSASRQAAEAFLQGYQEPNPDDEIVTLDLQGYRRGSLNP